MSAQLNIGATALRDWLSRNALSQTQLSARIGTTQDRVSRWLSGERIPNRKHSVRLRDLCGIDPADWDKAAPAAEAAPQDPAKVA